MFEFVQNFSPEAETQEKKQALGLLALHYDVAELGTLPDRKGARGIRKSRLGTVQTHENS